MDIKKRSPWIQGHLLREINEQFIVVFSTHALAVPNRTSAGRNGPHHIMASLKLLQTQSVHTVAANHIAQPYYPHHQ